VYITVIPFVSSVYDFLESSIKQKAHPCERCEKRNCEKLF
jgi:hypothetical protein